MVEQLLKLAQKNSTDIDLVCLCLRACSQSQAKRLLVPFIGQQLEETHLNIEFTLIIITRYLQVLDDEALLMKTLHSLAQKSDDDGFHRVMTHLTQQPGFSGITMKALSSPHLTPTLANALSQLIQNQRHKSSEQH
jgi:hypothetical protein